MKIKNATVWADSILKGVFYDEVEKRYKVYKKNALQETANITGINLHNNARFGMTSTKALRLLQESKIESDGICLIELGGNDCDYKWCEIASDPTKEHFPATSLEDFKKHIKTMVEFVRSKNVEPVLVSLPPLDPDKFFDWVSKGLDKDNIMKWLGNKNRIYTHHETYSLALLDVAHETKCHVINLREEMLLTPDFSKYICLDGMHLNQDGQKKIYDCFNKYLLKLEVN